MANFTDRAETIWFERFPMSLSPILAGMIELAWSPIRIVAGKVSDYVVPRMNRCYQVSLLLIPFSIVFFVIAVAGDNINKWVGWVLLIIGELGPAFTQTLLDGMMASHYNQTGRNISMRCERAKLVGDAISIWISSLLIDLFDVNTVFGIHSALLLAVAFCHFLVGRCGSIVGSGESVQLRSVPTQPEEESAVEPASPAHEQVTFRYTVFVTIMVAIPTCISTMFYFNRRVLGMSVTEIGTTETLGKLLKLAMTVLPSYFTPNRRYLCMTVGVGYLVVQQLKLLLVTRVVAEFLFNVAHVLLIELVFTCVESLMHLFYSLDATESTKQGREAEEMAKLSTSVTIGKIIRIAFEVIAMHVLGIDHTHYEEMPVLIQMTCYISVIGAYAALFV